MTSPSTISAIRVTAWALCLAACSPAGDDDHPASPCGPPAARAAVSLLDTGSDSLRMTVFHTPRESPSLHDPALAPDGSIWYADTWNSCIGRVLPEAGTVEDYPTPRAGMNPHGLDVDAAGVVWYAGTGTGTLGRLDPATGDHREIALPRNVRAPHTILASGDRVWFTDPGTGVVGVVDRRTDDVDVVHAPLDGSGAYGLAAATDGAVWVALSGTHHLGRIDPAGNRMTLYEIPLTDARPRRVAVDAGDRVWFTDRAGHRVGRLDPSTGEVDLFPGASGNPFPLSIAAGPDGRIWVYEEGARVLAALDAATGDRLLSIALDAPGVLVRHMVADAERGALWLAIGESGGIARLDRLPRELGPVSGDAVAPDAAGSRSDTSVLVRRDAPVHCQDAKCR